MKQTLTIFFVLFGGFCLANMSSPISEGTLNSSAYSSRDIDIQKEKIFIKIDKDFKTAQYQVEYFILADSSGKQIPLLFHAKDYKGDFKVWIDDQEVKLLSIPDEYVITANSPFEKFSNSVEEIRHNKGQECVLLYWYENSGNYFPINDLKYFETDLAKGTHTIRVEYTANAWNDHSDWVKKYSFRYSLSPAKHWKSFGSLEIFVDATSPKSTFTTNLGLPNQRNKDGVFVWKFTKLPSEFIEIEYKSEISSMAKILIAIGPVGFTIIFAFLLVLFHFFGIIRYRKRNPTIKYSWVVIAGSISIPLFLFIGFMVSFGIIDSAIGPEASTRHGYTFLAIFLYPVIMPWYWLIMWFVDYVLKKRINKLPLFDFK